LKFRHRPLMGRQPAADLRRRGGQHREGFSKTLVDTNPPNKYVWPDGLRSAPQRGLPSLMAETSGAYVVLAMIAAVLIYAALR